MKLIKLIMIRHGESQWNYENRFTGWTDIDLSNKGRIEAKNAGLMLKRKGFVFDFAYTSFLKRAIHTMWIILDELNQAWLPIEKSWYLNERHYGALQGLNKQETIEKYGLKQVEQWRRSLYTMPPKINKNDKRFPGHDIRYSNIKELPIAENLAMTITRVMFFFNKKILPRILRGEKIILIAHGNSIRSIIKSLSNLNEKEIINLEIPTGIPIIYEFNQSLKSIRYYYLN